MRLRFAAAMVVLFVVAFGEAVWPASVKVQEAVLYVSAPAEVMASVTLAGPSAHFDLPKSLVPNSLQATQGGTNLSALLQPVYAPAKGQRPRELQRYQARVPGARAGTPVQLRFRAGGLSWTPAMSLQFSAQQAHLQVQASLANQALDLTGAKLQLMSGRVAGAQDALSRVSDYPGYDWYEDMLSDYGRTASEEDRGALHAVTELPASDLPVGSTRQVPIISADVAASRTYRWDTHLARGERDLSESARPERAWAVYSFPNATGSALPEGKVTVSEGATAVGDGYLARTPAGQTAVIAVGSVQGLTVRRAEESKPEPKTWENRKTVKLQVESNRAEQVTVHVTEHLQSDREYRREDKTKPVFEFSQQPQIGEEGKFVWDLPVPARGEATLTYSYGESIELTALWILRITPDDGLGERQCIFESDRSPVQLVKDTGGERIRRIQPEGHITYRLTVPSNVPRADLMVGGGNTLRVSLAPEVNGKPGAFTVVADLAAIAGRPVNDASNYSNFTFDLTPYLGENHVAYVRLDNPQGGEAFFAYVDVYRVPEGFSSGGHEYPVGEAAASAPSGPRRVLFSFYPGTAEEEKSMLLNRGTVVVDKARAAFMSNRMIYSFTVPPNVTGADFIVDAWGSFILAVAGDAGGTPGEFHEEVNIPKLFGRKAYGEESKQDYPVDLTPYLKENPSRTIYVALYSADPTTGWGVAAWRRVEVAALDDTEQARLARLRRQLDLFVKDDRARYPLDLRTNSEEAERSYLYEDRGSHVQPVGRILEGDAAVTYRLPLKPEYRGHQVRVWVLGDFLVSWAADDHGKPGAFTDVLRARDKYDQRTIEEHVGVPVVAIDLSQPMLDSGAIYIKIRDGALPIGPETSRSTS
jgi:hypothetical protein